MAYLHDQGSRTKAVFSGQLPHVRQFLFGGLSDLGQGAARPDVSPTFMSASPCTIQAGASVSLSRAAPVARISATVSWSA